MEILWIIVAIFLLVVTPVGGSPSVGDLVVPCVGAFWILAAGGLWISVKVGRERMTEGQIIRRVWLMRWLPLWGTAASVAYLYFCSSLLLNASPRVWRFIWRLID